MNLNSILQWISMNGLAAFFIGCFLCTIVGIIADAFIKFVRSITGHYPQPDTVVSCDCAHPCKCCREGDCQQNCDCWADKIDEEE